MSMPSKRGEMIMDLTHSAHKKASKPLMEKRRRARINQCLAQLKTLIIDPTNMERTKPSKLEKADILELTVRHLQNMKRKEREVLTSVSTKKFQVGYTECVREVETFMSNSVGEFELQRRLKDHLSKKLRDLQSSESSSREASDDELVKTSSHTEDPSYLKMDSSKSELHSVSPDTTWSSSQEARHSLAVDDTRRGSSPYEITQSPGRFLVDHETEASSLNDNEESPDRFRHSHGTVVSPIFPKTEDILNPVHQQIALMPRLLPNGEWALVFPARLVNGKDGKDDHPLSAFRLVWPMVKREEASPRQDALSPASKDDILWRPW